MVNFESYLARETLRRDAALQRMHEACSATKWTVQQQKDEIKSDLNRITQDLTPRGIVQNHPWPSILGAMAVGMGLAAALKSLFGTKKHTAVATREGTQRVVVQVEGAQPKKAPGTSGWKEILDAAMHGLPALMAFAESQLQNSAPRREGNGHASEESATVAAPTAKTSPDEKPFKASISRRTAPPPRES